MCFILFCVTYFNRLNEHLMIWWKIYFIWFFNQSLYKFQLVDKQFLFKKKNMVNKISKAFKLQKKHIFFYVVIYKVEIFFTIQIKEKINKLNEQFRNIYKQGRLWLGYRIQVLFLNPNRTWNCFQKKKAFCKSFPPLIKIVIYI